MLFIQNNIAVNYRRAHWENKSIMFVRVFDKNKNIYFKSIVYSTVEIGCRSKYIVLNPITNTFDLVDYFDESVTPWEPLVEKIQADYSYYSDSNAYKGSALLKYKHFCTTSGIEPVDLKLMVGYPDVCENYAFLADIFTNKSVPVGKYRITIREPEDISEWNYIRTQSDANDFMEKFFGFHDSTIEKISYSESDIYTSAVVTFDNSDWYGIVELCFEGIQMLKIQPATENYGRDIFEASLIVENESVFWADSYMEVPDTSYDGSVIKALNLKWRKV